MTMFFTPHCSLSACSTSCTSASFTSSVTPRGRGLAAAAEVPAGGEPAAPLASARVARRRTIFTGAGLNTLDDHGNPLPSADARGGEAVALLPPAQFVEHGEH